MEKEKAQELFNKHYCILLDDGDDLSQEVLISILSRKLAILTAQEIYDHTLDTFWLDVTEEINKL